MISRSRPFAKRWEWRRGQVEVLHVLGRREDEQAALESLAAASGAPARSHPAPAVHATTAAAPASAAARRTMEKGAVIILAGASARSPSGRG